MKSVFASLIVILNTVITTAVAQDNTGLRDVWLKVYAAMGDIAKSGNNEQQTAKAREIVDGLSMAKISAAPANQLAETVGRLSAALFILGEKGNTSDIDRLLRFAEIRLPNPRYVYAGGIWIVGGLISSDGDDEQQRVPSCYSLCTILKRNPNFTTNAILNSTIHYPPVCTLRILGALIRARYTGANDYAARIRVRFGSDKVNQSVEDLELGVKWYWSVDLLTNGG